MAWRKAWIVAAWSGAALGLSTACLAQAQEATEPAGADRLVAPKLRPAGDFQSSIARSEIRERALGLLASLGDTSDSAQVRANAVEAMSRAPARAEALTRKALRDQNLGVRFAACFAVGKAKMKKLAPDVRPLLEDPSLDVRAAAIYALRRCGADVDPTPLATMLEARDVRLRSNVAMLLGEMGEPSAAPMLRAAARDTTLPGTAIQRRLVRLQIGEALYRLGDHEQIHPIRAALYPVGPDDVEAATLAAQIIGNVGDKDASAELKNRVLDRVAPEGDVKDPNLLPFLNPPELRLAAVTSLGKLGIRNGVYVADEYALSPEPILRAQASFAYGETGDMAELPKLEFLMGDDAEMVRVAAAGAVVKVVDRLASGSR